MQVVNPAIVSKLYQECVDPELNVQYGRCEGVELHVADGRTILDFLSGYGAQNAGHNHPRIIAALREEPARGGPAMLQSQLRKSLAGCDVVKEVRGIGLMDGIEFQAPGRLNLRLYFGAVTSGALWMEALALARGVMNV